MPAAQGSTVDLSCLNRVELEHDNIGWRETA